MAGLPSTSPRRMYSPPSRVDRATSAVVSGPEVHVVVDLEADHDLAGSRSGVTLGDLAHLDAGQAHRASRPFRPAASGRTALIR